MTWLAGSLNRTDLTIEVEVPRNQVGATLTDQIVFVAIRVESFDRFGRQRKQSEPVGRISPPAIQPHLGEADDERVIRFSAFDIERPGERVAGLASADVLVILSTGIDRFGDDGDAGLHTFEHRVCARKGVVVGRGDHLLNLSRRDRFRTRSQAREPAEERGARDGRSQQWKGLPFHTCSFGISSCDPILLPTNLRRHPSSRGSARSALPRRSCESALWPLRN